MRGAGHRAGAFCSGAPVTRHYRILNHFHLKKINLIFNNASRDIFHSVKRPLWLAFDGNEIFCIQEATLNDSFSFVIFCGSNGSHLV